MADISKPPPGRCSMMVDCGGAIFFAARAVPEWGYLAGCAKSYSSFGEGQMLIYGALGQKPLELSLKLFDVLP